MHGGGGSSNIKGRLEVFFLSFLRWDILFDLDLA